MDDSVFVNDVVTEAARARKLFPSNQEMFEALVEEVGEVSKALLEHKRGKVTDHHVYAELVQLAAMAMRLATEGDRDHPYVNPNKAP